MPVYLSKDHNYVLRNSYPLRTFVRRLSTSTVQLRWLELPCSKALKYYDYCASKRLYRIVPSAGLCWSLAGSDLEHLSRQSVCVTQSRRERVRKSEMKRREAQTLHCFSSDINCTCLQPLFSNVTRRILDFKRGCQWWRKRVKNTLILYLYGLQSITPPR